MDMMFHEEKIRIIDECVKAVNNAEATKEELGAWVFWCLDKASELKHRLTHELDRQDLEVFLEAVKEDVLRRVKVTEPIEPAEEILSAYEKVPESIRVFTMLSNIFSRFLLDTGEHPGMHDLKVALILNVADNFANEFKKVH